MVMPARQFRDGLLTHRTDAPLFPPKIQQASPTCEGVGHLHPKTGFEIAFPLWVIRVSRSFHFDVPFDWRVGQSNQPVLLGFASARRCRTKENPVVVGHTGKDWSINYCRMLWDRTIVPLG